MLIWALLGPRTGDNNQVLALAEAVARATGGEVRRLPLRYNALRLLPNRIDAGRACLDAPSRALLAPPWPDLVIGVGQRSVPVARWIRRRCGAPVVQLGRPRCHPSRLDLVITTPQYGVPPGPQVLELPAVLTPPPPPAAAGEAVAALVLGGPSWPWQLDAAAIEAACTRLLAGPLPLRVIASRRTPPAIIARLRALLPPGAFLEGAGAYRDLLGRAAGITVTADSVSMVSEALATGRPVHRLPLRLRPLAGAWLRLMRALRRGDAGEGPAVARLAGRAWGALVRRGLVGWPRDLWFFWRGLDHGRPTAAAGDPTALMAMAVARIRQLLPAPAPGSGRGSGRPG